MIILSERGAQPACREGRWIVKFLFPCLSPLSPKKWDATKLSSLLAISDTRLHNTRTLLPLSLSLCITEYSIVFVRLLIESFSVFLLTVGGLEPVISLRGGLMWIFTVLPSVRRGECGHTFHSLRISLSSSTLHRHRVTAPVQLHQSDPASSHLGIGNKNREMWSENDWNSIQSQLSITTITTFPLISPSFFSSLVWRDASSWSKPVGWQEEEEQFC